MSWRLHLIKTFLCQHRLRKWRKVTDPALHIEQLVLLSSEQIKTPLISLIKWNVHIFALLFVCGFVYLLFVGGLMVWLFVWWLVCVYSWTRERCIFASSLMLWCYKLFAYKLCSRDFIIATPFFHYPNGVGFVILSCGLAHYTERNIPVVISAKTKTHTVQLCICEF